MFYQIYLIFLSFYTNSRHALVLFEIYILKTNIPSKTT